MSTSVRTVASSALAILFFVAHVAHAKTETIWSDGLQDFVRLSPVESGADNAHPVTIDAQQLMRLLAATQVKNSKGKYEALFADDEGEYLARALSKGFAKATSNQDIIFFSTARRSSDALIPIKSGTAGRLFFSNGKINLIIGTAHMEYVAQLSASKVMPPFSFGNRGNTSTTVNLRADVAQAGAHRGDWLVFNVNKDGSIATTPAAKPADPANTETQNDALGEQQEARLRRLQRLHDQGLVTDEEYQKKRQEILRDL